MAKNNNITDLLTDVADAIREKKGTTDKINPQNFSAEIKDIKSGGGAWVEPEESMVNFYDYDGTLLYAYTWEEASQLTEMPTPPYEHEGLVFAGWNYTLDDLFAQGDCADIGAMYTTDNGLLRLKATTSSATVRVTVVGTATVYWGDGTAEQTSGTTTLMHTYEKAGTYNIEIEGGVTVRDLIGVASTEIYAGNFTATLGTMTICGLQAVATNPSLKADERWLTGVPMKMVVVPPRTDKQLYSFHSSNVMRVSIPSVESRLSDTFMYGNGKAQRFVIPAKISINIAASSNNFVAKSSLTQIKVAKNNTTLSSSDSNVILEKNTGKLFVGGTCARIPEGTTEICGQAFAQCNYLQSLELPEGLIAIGDSAFLACQNLTEATFPDSLQTLSSGAYNNTGLRRVSFGSGLTTLSSMCLVYSYKMEVIDCRRCVKVPTMQNTNALNGLPATTKIVIPDALFSEWSTATNWATYANRMVRESEYVES